MDSLRKRVPAAPRPIPKIEQTRPQFVKPKPLPKREDLYISPAESHNMDQKLGTHEEKFQRGVKLKKFLKIFSLILIIILSAVISYFVWKTYNVSKKMNARQTSFSSSMLSLAKPLTQGSNRSTLKGEENGRVNILMLGAAGEHKPGGNLTDTIMVMSIDTKNKKVALLSLPRDFYSPIAEDGNFAKLNSLYPIGIKEGQGIDIIKNAVEKITGQTLNYYLVVDFDAFEKIIDNIGGINIVSERDIYDATYPGPNYSYQTFSLSKGFHQLDGATALKYVRERHDDPQGDFGRAKRQQQVIQAVKNKMFSVQTMLNVVAISNVLDTLGDNIKTDIQFNEMESFVALSETLDLENINNVVVDAWKPDSLLKVSHVATARGNAFILIPRVGNYSEIQDTANNIFNQDELKKRREKIASEDAKILIINQSGDNKLISKIKELLSDKLNLKKVSVEYTQQDSIEPVTTVLQKNSSEKIFTLDELIKKLPAKLSDSSLSEETENDFVITLGSDLAEKYSYDEDKISFEEFSKSQDDNNPNQ